MIREFKEELNLNVKNVYSLETKFEYSLINQNHCTYFYLVKAEGKIELDFENEDYKFVHRNDLKMFLDESLSAALTAFEKIKDI